jgi:hypothetical protein
MNMWGLKPGLIKILGERFRSFLRVLDNMPYEKRLTAEYLLPFVIDDLIHEGRATVNVLPVSDKWYGVTYHEDKEAIMKAIADMVSRNIYKEKLFG